VNTVRALLWLLPAFALEGVSAFLLRGTDTTLTLVLGALSFLATVPFFVRGMGEKVALGAYYAVWNIGIVVVHSLVGIALGEIPTSIDAVALAIAYTLVAMLYAAKVSAATELGSFAEEGHPADEKFAGWLVFLDASVVVMVSAAALFVQAFEYVWFVAGFAYAAADVSGAPFSYGFRQLLFSGRMTKLAHLVSELVGYLPAVVIYSLLLRDTMEKLVIVGVVTSGMEVILASVMQSLHKGERLKLRPVLFLTLLTALSGIMWTAAFS